MNFGRGLNLHKSQILSIAIICSLTGVIIGNFANINPFIIFCLLLISAFGLIFYLPQIGSAKKGLSKLMPIVFLFALFFFLGLFRYQISLPDYSDRGKIYHYNGEKVQFIGVVSKVDRRLGYQKLTINSKRIINNKQAMVVRGKVLLNHGLYPIYNYGDELEVYCELAKPKKVEDFDYEKYLARYNIYSLCSFADIRLVEKNQGSWLMERIFGLKTKMSHGLNLSISEPQASLMQGMILADTGSISANWNQKFSDLGITHIIAVSGSHMVVISAILMYIAIALGIRRKEAFWVASIGIGFYTIMIGMPSSAVRSAVMGIMFLYAQKVGRPGSAGNLILLSAVGMVLINPKVLLSDVGFQLSFMAVIGLVYFLPVLERYLQRVPNIWQLKEMALTTVAAQLATLPLLIFYFQKISPISILANMLILPIIPALMILGFVNAIVSIVFLPLAGLIGMVNWLLVSYWLKITALLHTCPYGFFSVRMGTRGLIIMYVVVFILFWLLSKKASNSVNRKNML